METTEQPQAQTAQGPVAGRTRRGAHRFSGIPYAASPTGELRFAPPQAPEPWEGVRDARRSGPAAPQLPGEGLTNRIPVDWDEDCLTLNIVTPAVDDQQRPVYVWIHGGAYLHGQGAVPWYDGTSFALTSDIVVVTINYRLGALGFCNLGPHFPQDTQLATAGLNGTLDQIAALRWIKENIANFGGDPERITIGGESAVAFSVCNLMASPETDGLFHQAIAQSGAAHHIHPPEDGTAIAGELLAELGHPSAEELRTLPVLDILEAQQRVIENDHNRAQGVNAFYPVWGSAALPQPPADLLAQGAAADVALLIGTNQDEMALWGITSLDLQQAERYVGRMVDQPENLLAVYRQRLGHLDPGWLACAISTDWVFRIPAIRLADNRHAHQATTFMYQFSWDSQALDGLLGASHALEIPFTFNTLDRPGVSDFLGDVERPDAVAQAMHQAWGAFITTGNPSTETLGAWPTYTPQDRHVMEFDDQHTLLSDPEPQERELWQHLR